MEIKASLKNYRISAQKARLVVNQVRGKGVEEALDTLSALGRDHHAGVPRSEPLPLSGAGQDSQTGPTAPRPRDRGRVAVSVFVDQESPKVPIANL